jgi:hypothetical protein
MPDRLRPLDLHEAAHALGEHPFEVVRLLVASGGKLTPGIPRDRIDALRAFGGIEDWWTGHALPADANRARAVVRGVVDALLQRDRIGERTARRENLVRGLPPGDLDIAIFAVGTLIDLGWLAHVRTPSGTLVSVHPEWADAARALVARGQAPAEVAAIWEG